MRIIWLKSELLHPVDKGGRIRTYYMLRELKRAHEITYLTLDDGTGAPDAADRASEYCDELIRIPFRAPAKFTPAFYGDLARNIASPLPYAVQKYRSASLRDAIGRIATRGDVDVLVCDFLAPSPNVPDGLPCATVLFQHNVEALIWQRHWQVARNPMKRAYFWDQWRKMRRFEAAECRRYDHVIAVSAADREIIEHEYSLRGRVSDVPTGVDTDVFRPCGEACIEPNSLVFTGSMDWLPNADAIRYFAAEILPRIRYRVPDVKLTVVGRHPTPDLVELARREPAIVLTGFVDDVRPYVERAAVYVVPLRIGGGTRLKLYEAMAMERPVISTTIGAEGLPVTPGEELLLADAPQHFADAVVALLHDPLRARQIGRSAAARVRRDFGWEGVAARFAEICERTARGTVAA